MFNRYFHNRENLVFYGNSRQYIEAQLEKHNGIFKHDSGKPIHIYKNLSGALEYAHQRAVVMKDKQFPPDSATFIEINLTEDLKKRLTPIENVPYQTRADYICDFLKKEEFTFGYYE